MSQEVASLPDLLSFMASTAQASAKAFCRLGALSAPAASVAAGILSVADHTFNLLIDTDGVRHSLAQHGLAKRKAEEARGQIPLVEADLLDLAIWLAQPTTVQAGQVKPGKQPRVELQWEAPAGTTIAILEWRPGRQQLALVTMYKKSQLPK